MNGFRWKICWRLKPEYRNGTRSSRRFVVYQYRKGYPKAAELRALAKRNPQYEFRVYRIGEGC
jgi:hypothetical protein